MQAFREKSADFLRRAVRAGRFAVAGVRAPASVKRDSVVYIGDRGDWVVKRIGDRIQARSEAAGLEFGRETIPDFFVNKLLHFGSLHNLASGLRRKGRTLSCAIVGNVYHGDRGIDGAFDEAIGLVLRNEAAIDKIVLSTSIMRKRFLEWGFPEKKLVLIPIGFDAEQFHPLPEERKRELRRELNLPLDAVVIGSFQKDGQGWGDGAEPKLIKGPDLFVESVGRLRNDFPVYCLLTGPARGYVRRRLEEAGVPFVHEYPKSTARMNELYNCLDLYVVSSREEGGPIALMESMASGTPLVSTSVGMAPDIIQNGHNAVLVPSAEADLIEKGCRSLLLDREKMRRLSLASPDTVKHLSWNEVSKRYLELYRDLLRQGSC